MDRIFAGVVLMASLVALPALSQNSSPMNAQQHPGMPGMAGMEEMHHASAPAPGPLRVSFGAKTSDFTPEQLAALPHTTISVYNEHEKANQTYSGVPLIDLLTPLGVSAKPHGKEFRFYVVAEGADDYQVVYSIGEITPDVHDGTVLVADSVNGKSLGNNGVFQLVAIGEKRPARWVRNLVAVRVLPAQ